MRLLLGAGAVVLVTSLASACSPMYVIRAGIAEAKILRARRPIPEVILDPATDERTKTKLTFVVEARNYAIDEFGLDVGRSYTSFSQLKSDTLAMVLSAAHQDQLTPKTWWFPIVGRVPYKGYFNENAAIEEQGEARRRRLRYFSAAHRGVQYTRVVRGSPSIQPPPAR